MKTSLIFITLLSTSISAQDICRSNETSIENYYNKVLQARENYGQVAKEYVELCNFKEFDDLAAASEEVIHAHELIEEEDHVKCIPTSYARGHSVNTFTKKVGANSLCFNQEGEAVLEVNYKTKYKETGFIEDRAFYGLIKTKYATGYTFSLLDIEVDTIE